jgi:hypothetical protein
MMFASIIFFGLGVFFGITIAYNCKDYRQQKTFEQVDEEVRNDLERYKSLSESLKADVKYLKNKISFMKQGNVQEQGLVQHFRA